MFIDEIAIHVKAGDGGNGCVCFRREKFVPKGGPDGGDGGDGGSVILEATLSIRTLLNLRLRSMFKADKGAPGSGKNKTGRRGADLILSVPAGTVVKDEESGEILGDLKVAGDTLVIAHGGRRGRGNARFATSTNQAPRHAEKGSPGEERRLHLELKLIADVGLIGLPNAGKSTLISKISSAKPRIADYPFTTLQPNLGMAMTDMSDGAKDQSFCIADIPGLIQGAHQGIGLGDRFLRHIERSRILVHMVDVSSSTGPDDPIEAFYTVSEEMRLYSEALTLKKQIVVANKIDDVAQDKLQALEHLCQENGYPFMKISAATGENTKSLVRLLQQTLSELDQEERNGTTPEQNEITERDKTIKRNETAERNQTTEA
jgi:GTPase